ncbi:MAG: hypothetical protein RLZZ299_1494 [Pseudomonadota bacterium]|jgi:uncharacterized protein (DUF2062 family)
MERRPTLIERLRARLGGVLGANLSPLAVGGAVAVGVYIGCMPLLGVHWLLCLGAARLFRLNQALTLLASGVCNPITYPFMLFAEIAVGRWLMGGDVDSVVVPATRAEVFAMLRDGGRLLGECLIGSVLVGGALAVVCGACAMVVARVAALRRAGA